MWILRAFLKHILLRVLTLISQLATAVPKDSTTCLDSICDVSGDVGFGGEDELLVNLRIQSTFRSLLNNSSPAIVEVACWCYLVYSPLSSSFLLSSRLQRFFMFCTALFFELRKSRRCRYMHVKGAEYLACLVVGVGWVMLPCKCARHKSFVVWFSYFLQQCFWLHQLPWNNLMVRK